MKYDYDRTDKVLHYPHRDLIEHLLRKGPFSRGPFQAVRQPSVYSGFYIVIYVGPERIAFNDTVYSVDPEVIQAVQEFAAALDKAAVDLQEEEERKLSRARAAKEESRRSLFANAVKKWRG